MAYAVSDGNKPLTFSGKLVGRAARRLNETGRFVIETCRRDGLRRTGEGLRITIKVRLMHAQVRRLLLMSGRWKSEQWGVPINQADMAATNVTFSAVVLRGLHKLGVRMSARERAAAMQLWRYSGYLSGVEPSLLTATESEAQRLAELMWLTRRPADDDSRQLVRALMGCRLAPPLDRVGNVAGLLEAITRALVGDEVADELQLPRTRAAMLLPFLRVAVLSTEVARRVVPAFDRSLLRIGERVWELVISSGLARQACRVSNDDNDQGAANDTGGGGRRMSQTALEHLTEADWAMLRDRARRRTFNRGETILRQDDTHLALFVMHRGFARVERNEQGSGIAISSLGPGEIFGEMSFLEGTGASASVVADDVVEVDMIDGTAVQSLLISDPGLSVRFYRSLALSLSSRLRRASRDLAQLRVSDVPNGGQRPTVRTGHVQERQIPAELVAAVHDFREHIQEAVSQFARREIDQDSAQTTVSTSCSAMLRVLAQLTDHDALVAAGMDDPFSFRDPGELEAGYGAFVFREAFPIFMASATLARCHAKPRGHPDDWETLMRMHRDEPEGEGRLGVLVDRWFLSRPICRTIRASRDWMASLLVAAADDAGTSLNVTSASSKAASELLDAMAARPGAFRATCLDGDPSALREAARVARRLGIDADVSFVNTNVVRIAAGESPLGLPTQHLVYALGLFEYLDDAQVVSVLNWAHATLGEGGVFVGTNPSFPGVDRVLAEHILEWPMVYRSDDALRGLVAQSAFGVNAQLEIALDAAKGTWFLRCVRA